MTGRVVIVTGASSGIGYEVARMLCEGGNDVILACRNEEKTQRSIDKIKKQNPSALATYMHLDLADLESVRKFVDEFHASEKKLSVLINNAGVAMNMKDTKRQYTKDNFEVTMGANHLGHFLLTNLLLDDLKKSAADGQDARIVVVASELHNIAVAKKRGNVQPMDVDNFLLAGDGTYTGLQAYKNSKLAKILFTYELHRRLEGTGVKVNALCPGFVPTTDLLRFSPGAARFYCRYVLHGMLRFTKITRTVQQAATAITALATDEKYKEVSGKYFKDGAEAKSSEESLEEEKQKKVWELSARYTHLEGYEPLDAPPPPVEPEPKKEEPAAPNGDAKPADDEKNDTEGGDKPAEDAKPAEDKQAESEKPAEGDNAPKDKPAEPEKKEEESKPAEGGDGEKKEAAKEEGEGKTEE